MSAMIRRIPIELTSTTSTLLVGRGLLGSLAAHLGAEGILVPGRGVLVASDVNVRETHGAACIRALESAGARVTPLVLEAREDRKAMRAVEAVWSAALASRLDRSALFVAVGGGLVGDLVGFAAATYLRGVELVQVPTSLLAMVDAAIGGKTGVNLILPDGTLGKNLAGAMHQPKATIADPACLTTLPDREYRAGLAECVKHALIDGEAAFAALEIDAPALAARDAEAIDRLVPRSAAIKAAVVGRDPFEQGDRMTLNLGHTFGHAFETAEGMELLHGEAVAIGLCAAARCAGASGHLEAGAGAGTGSATALERRLEMLLYTLGLPRTLPVPASAASIRGRMGFDKKAAHGRLRLVLPRAIGRVEVATVEPGSALDRAIDTALVAVGCRPA